MQDKHGHTSVASFTTSYNIALSRKEFKELQPELKQYQRIIMEYYRNHVWVDKCKIEIVKRLDSLVEFRFEVVMHSEVMDFENFGESEDKAEFLE